MNVRLTSQLHKLLIKSYGGGDDSWYGYFLIARSAMYAAPRMHQQRNQIEVFCRPMTGLNSQQERPQSNNSISDWIRGKRIGYIPLLQRSSPWPLKLLSRHFPQYWTGTCY